MSDSITGISSLPAVTDVESPLAAQFRSLEVSSNPTPEQLKKVAQNFEGVLLEKLLQEMQNTIPESELFSSAGMKQIQNMFWSFLSDEMAQNGGIGLARSLYRDLCHTAGVDPAGTGKGVSPSRSHLARYLDDAAEPMARMELKR